MKFFLIFALLALVSCAAPPQPTTYTPPPINWDDPLETKNRAYVDVDEFTKVTNYLAEVRGDNEWGGFVDGWVDRLLIRAISTRDSKTPVLYQIYVVAVAGKSRYFTSAYDSDGNSLDVTRIGTESDTYYVVRKSYVSKETIGVNVSREYLESHVKKGLRFKLIGQYGEQVININGPCIEGFLLSLPNSI